VRLEDAAHVEQLKRVFRAANDHRLAIVLHMRANISRGRPYGEEQARTFLEELLPLASEIPVQVAHMAGTGPGYDDPPADKALAVLAEAVASQDPRAQRLRFDVTTCADPNISEANASLLARRIRQIGVSRVLYGSDAAAGGNLRPRESWAAFRRLPLTEQEFAAIAGNAAPYVR
jgi:predicted TIM-barrel fold metal-dependent hydrolase